MFNAITVQDELVSLIGWRKDKNPEVTQNPMGDLLTASTGLFYNDAHRLLTSGNLNAVFADFARFTYPTFSLATSYSKGTIVKESANYFISLQDANLNHATNLTAWWRQTTPTNEQYREITTSGITLGLNQWLDRKYKLKTASNLLERKTVLSLPGYKAEEIGTTKRYLGWRLCPTPKYPDIINTIDRVCIHMKQSQTVTVSLYRNGSSTPIHSVIFTGDATPDPIWMDAGWELDPGSFYYLAYDRQALTNPTAIPYNDIQNMDKSAFAYNRFPGTLPFMEVSAFEHDGPGNSGWEDVTDIQKNDNNYGLNVAISSRCDYTSLIVEQKDTFKMVCFYAVAIEALKFLIYNPSARVTREKLNIPDSQLLFEIQGNPDAKKKTGLEKSLWDAIDNTTLDQRKLCKYCLPARKSSITFTST